MKTSLTNRGVLLQAAYGVLHCLLTALHPHVHSTAGGGGVFGGGGSGGGGGTPAPSGIMTGATLRTGVGAGEGLLVSYGLARDPMIRTALLTVLNHFR